MRSHKQQPLHEVKTGCCIQNYTPGMSKKTCTHCGGNGRCYDDKCVNGVHISGLRKCRICGGDNKCVVCGGTGLEEVVTAES